MDFEFSKFLILFFFFGFSISSPFAQSDFVRTRKLFFTILKILSGIFGLFEYCCFGDYFSLALYSVSTLWNSSSESLLRSFSIIFLPIIMCFCSLRPFYTLYKVEQICNIQMEMSVYIYSD